MEILNELSLAGSPIPYESLKPLDLILSDDAEYWMQNVGEEDTTASIGEMVAYQRDLGEVCPKTAEVLDGVISKALEGKIKEAEGLNEVRLVTLAKIANGLANHCLGPWCQDL